MDRVKQTRRRRWLLMAGLLAAAIGLALYAWADELQLGDRSRQLTQAIVAFNPLIVFLLMAILPMFGFSVAIVYVVAGLKFGPVMGGVMVLAATAVHLVGSHWICRSMLRERVKRFLARRNHQLPHIPAGADAAVAATAALVPGVPYFARNYLLALTDIPLRVYFWVCLPIYVIRSSVAILVGDLGTDPDRGTLVILGAVYVVKLAVCGYLIWWIRRRFKLERAHAV